MSHPCHKTRIIAKNCNYVWMTWHDSDLFAKRVINILAFLWNRTYDIILYALHMLFHLWTIQKIVWNRFLHYQMWLEVLLTCHFVMWWLIFYMFGIFVENKIVQKHVSMTILETKRVIFITKQFFFWFFNCLFVTSGGKFCVFILFVRAPLKINMVRMKLMLLSMHLTLLKMFFGVYIVI